jgi:AraC-like DNA-binding protein
MRWFSPYAPSPDIGNLLACRYVAVSAGHHDLIPDGCMDLVWSPRLGAVLCGPDTHAWSFDLPAGEPVAGVRFRAGAAASVFRVEAASLVDRRVPLADLVGARPARLLAEQLAAHTDPLARMTLLEGLVRHRAPAPEPTAELAALVAADPTRGVDDLVRHGGWSARQLRRRFDRAVGYGPAFFARVARLQRFAQHAARQPDRSLAELAALAGYTDQAHLAKDARAIAGRTPRELVTVLDRSSLAVELPVVPADGRSVQDAHRRPAARSAA